MIGKTDAVILNVDYPLGMAAYYIGRQIAERIVDLRGFYVLGKAATLNGAVGDVMFADEVFDEHTGNVYSFPNAFGYDEVAPWLERGSALDRQKAVTVRGTFLQNRDYLELFYREAYTIVEMEAGPYLSAVYEATYPERHPLDDAVHFRDLPFDVGFIHYASDTPYTRARTLGSRRLSFEGIDSTYAATVAITRRILEREAERLGIRAVTVLLTFPVRLWPRRRSGRSCRTPCWCRWRLRRNRQIRWWRLVLGAATRHPGSAGWSATAWAIRILSMPPSSGCRVGPPGDGGRRRLLAGDRRRARRLEAAGDRGAAARSFASARAGRPLREVPLGTFLSLGGHCARRPVRALAARAGRPRGTALAAALT